MAQLLRMTHTTARTPLILTACLLLLAVGPIHARASVLDFERHDPGAPWGADVKLECLPLEVAWLRADLLTASTPRA